MRKVYCAFIWRGCREGRRKEYKIAYSFLSIFLDRDWAIGVLSCLCT